MLNTKTLLSAALIFVFGTAAGILALYLLDYLKELGYSLLGPFRDGRTRSQGA